MSQAIAADITVQVGATDAPFELHAKLSLDDGVLVLFGPSGSGKSLTLQCIVGVVRPKGGRIIVRDRVLFDADDGTRVPPHQRNIGYVPQHHSLFPFCNVRDNVAFGLPRAERARSTIVEQLIEELGIAHLRKAMPASLSGGERQRVALARALAVRPKLLVLDEPFASIDVTGRGDLRTIVRETLKRHGMPALFVTHDPTEAREMGDWTVLFERGRTTDEGRPHELLS